MVGTSAGDFAYSVSNDWIVKSQKIVSFGGPSNWKVGAIADFNSDGISDVAWYNPPTGQTAIWTMGTSLNYQSNFSASTGANGGWEMRGSGNFDGDGKKDDILWFNRNTGSVAVWLMENGTLQQSKFVGSAVSSPWNPSAIFDRNNDGISDRVFEKLKEV